MAGRLQRVLCRRKLFPEDQLDAGNLRRCLSAWDVTALGVGSSLGVGVYVLVGAVALHLAGPSVVLSFLIAAVAAVFAGMCYAELGARVPKAGSAYVYAYVTVGEFVAFIVGWDMILEAVFGTASVARGLSMYVDSISNHTMSAWFQSFAPMSHGLFSPHFDFFAFFVVLLLGGLLAIGVRESSLINNALTAVNLFVILFVVLAGAFKADSANWSIPAEQVPDERGSGGFFPYGALGVLRGAAVCFYGFVGFDAISFTGEEVRNPRRSIPVSIVSSLAVVFAAYAAVSIVVTMMMPYYLQETVGSIATAFTYVGWEWARWIVTVGAIVGISASLYGAMFPLPRLLYSMASDGLLVHWLATVTSTRQSPALATLLAAAVVATLAAILELNELILMMCIGTLISYTLVAACVILLRYRSNTVSTDASIMKQMFGMGQKTPTRNSSFIINITLMLFMCTCITTGLIAHHVEQNVVYVGVLHAVALALVIIMALQPQTKEKLSFKTPLVPLVPCLSIYANIQLMILIKIQTWLRVLIWIAIGIPIYIICVCCYKQRVEEDLEDTINSSIQPNINGKTPIQIYVLSPTPPGTMQRSTKGDEIHANEMQEIQFAHFEKDIINKIPFVTEEIIFQHAYYEDNEEKEAKIIDLLDQVIQAEEDSYGEIISLKEQDNNKNQEQNDPKAHEVHRKSLSELSDAGSDASVGNQVLSKYDVIAQVHREDLPKVNEEEEKSDRDDDMNTENEIIDHEDVTAFNDSDSRTDESGYSDTIDRTILNDSTNDLQEEAPYIPVPPPLDENFFASPTFKKSYTISVRPPKMKPIEAEEENKPRESILSNNSVDDTPMVFGSDKQMNFMSKLNDIFQNKIATEYEDDSQRKRSNSTGNVVDKPDEVRRPVMLFDLKKEIMSREAAQNLRHVNVEGKETDEPEEEGDKSMSREDLKSKLESIFAAGGPQPLKKRIMKSNPPTPEEFYQTDTSSTESLSKLPKMEKNDTLKRQRTKFGEVLNSFKMTLNKDDMV